MRIATTVIPPGTYEFHIRQNTQVLEVLDHRTKAVVAHAYTVPHERNVFFEVDSANQFVYYPVVTELPQTLRTWFPANTLLGRDIVTPKSVVAEIELALARHREEEQMASRRVEESSSEVAVAQEGPALTTPVTPETTIAENTAPRAAMPRKLPLTASDQPMYTFLGLTALLGATLVSAYRKVTS